MWGRLSGILCAVHLKKQQSWACCLYSSLGPFCPDFLWLFIHRELCESEDAASLPSFPSLPTENGTVTTEMRSRPCSKSTLEENAYEDIVGKQTYLLALEYSTPASALTLSLAVFNTWGYFNLSKWVLQTVGYIFICIHFSWFNARC